MISVRQVTLVMTLLAMASCTESSPSNVDSAPVNDSAAVIDSTAIVTVVRETYPDAILELSLFRNTAGCIMAVVGGETVPAVFIEGWTASEDALQFEGATYEFNEELRTGGAVVRDEFLTLGICRIQDSTALVTRPLE